MENEQTQTSTVETPEVTDNSEVTNEQIREELDKEDSTQTTQEETKEPDENGDNKEPENEEQKDNTVECPDKFKNEDGSANLEKLLKSYKELESNSSKKESEWSKERAELLKAKEQLDAAHQAEEERAKSAGYESVKDMEQTYELAYLEANEYAKYLQYTDDPEEVRQKLMQYVNNPSAELMEDIEVEFPPEVNKRVAVASDRKKQEYAAQVKQYNETAKMTAIENVIGQSVDSNPEIFGYEPFKNLFVSTLQKYGDNFTFDDAKALINAFSQMKDVYKAEFEKQTGTKIANEKAIDKISNIGTNSAPGARQISNDDIDKMSPSELAKEIRKYL